MGLDQFDEPLEPYPKPHAEYYGAQRETVTGLNESSASDDDRSRRKPKMS